MYDKNSCLPEIFDRVVKTHPERIAISAPDGELTYRDLNDRADALAHRLSRYGVGPNVVVALYTERTTDMVVGLLGILKAGGAYLPIDPGTPLARVRWLIENSHSPVIVTVARLAPGVTGGESPVLSIDEPAEDTRPGPPLAPAVTENDLAYVIYTSGSTGTPKGVAVEHRNVVRLFEQTRTWLAAGAADTWAAFHSVAFDFSVWEIWGALLHGGRLVIVPFDVSRSPVRFLALLTAERITVLSQTPSAFRQLVTEAAAREPRLSALRLVILGGERLDVETLRPWFAQRGDARPVVMNMYGITETTVHASVHRVRVADLAAPEISPIGRPLPDLDFTVRDESGRAISDGAPGELHISGPGVARGYLGRPDLTAERFRSSRPGGRMEYRTGDLVRLLDDGGYAYLGRTDDQLKVRGFRIEPREIELLLNSHPEVDGSVVLAHDHGDGDVRLVGHLVPRPSTGATGSGWLKRIQVELAELVAEALPPHLRPSSYLAVPVLPMTRNGKVDRAALAEEGAARAENRQPELDSTRAVIAAVWRDVLDEQELDVDDDFFDLGGTSLTLVRMFRRVNAHFDTDLDFTVLVDEATIASLADKIDAARGPAPRREVMPA